MHDVVVVGGGRAGLALASFCRDAGLSVAIVEESLSKPESWAGEWVQGRGAVAAKGLVVALDPATADERRMLPCKAIVLAIGQMDADLHSQHLLGITKLGAEFTADGTQISTDEHGRTRAPGVFAAGSCASFGSQDIGPEVANYCMRTHNVKEAIS
jgi:thioredoxin reductase